MHAKVYKLGWKVVSREGERLTSVACSIIDCGVEYAFSKKTKPKMGNGPLAVFRTKKDAINFLDDKKLTFPCAYRESKYDHLWSGGNTRFKLPYGTVLADEVILLKEGKP